MTQTKSRTEPLLGMFQLHESLPDSHSRYEGKLLPHLATPDLRLVNEDSGEGGSEAASPAVRDLRSEVVRQLVEVVTEELPRPGPGLDPARPGDVPGVETVEVEAGEEEVGGGGRDGVPGDVPAGAEEGAGAGTAHHDLDVPVYQGSSVEVDIEHPAVHNLPVNVLEDSLEGCHDAGDTKPDRSEHLMGLREDRDGAAEGGGEFEPLEEAAS